jgi:hypothetical protein
VAGPCPADSSSRGGRAAAVSSPTRISAAAAAPRGNQPPNCPTKNICISHSINLGFTLVGFTLAAAFSHLLGGRGLRSLSRHIALDASSQPCVGWRHCHSISCMGHAAGVRTAPLWINCQARHLRHRTLSCQQPGSASPCLGAAFFVSISSRAHVALCCSWLAMAVCHQPWQPCYS